MPEDICAGLLASRCKEDSMGHAELKIHSTEHNTEHDAASTIQN